MGGVLLGQPPFGGLFVEARQVVARLAHHVDHAVEADAVFPVGVGGVDVGVQRTCCGVGVTFDAGDLNQTADGVARQSQVVLESHFGGVFDLCGGSAEELAPGRPSPGLAAYGV